MLTDKELDASSVQLEALRLISTQQQVSLSQVLGKSEALVEDYRNLKSDYEEARDSRERYKQMARGQERNPFVLVLVDGDGYVFEDNLVSNKDEGGQKAAQLLDEAVKRSLRDRGLEHCRIMFVDNPQCKHIYFAGCHDVGYINELTPHASNRDRITLVRHPAFLAEFKKLGLRIEDFPNIFRSTQLDSQHVIYAGHNQAAPNPLHKAIPQQAPPVWNAPQQMAFTGSTQRVCKYFQSGDCKYGKNCNNLHIRETTTGQRRPGIDNVKGVQSWRETNQSSAPPLFPVTTPAQSDSNMMSRTHNNSGDPVLKYPDFATQLPKDIPDGMIPVNARNYRLDEYANPLPDDVREFNYRTSRRKLCNNYHLQGSCPNSAEDCAYDHSYASPGVTSALRQVVNGTPCPRRGACRRLNCLSGHICQKADCKYRGGKAFCRLPFDVHTLQLEVARFVPGETPKNAKVSGNGASREENASASASGSTPRGESDTEQDVPEGALLSADAEDALHR
ncbi:hypothetical protein LTR59_005745 [Friedmanniomyces endolithicus]|nr:hypothetical protein LTR94_001377 [Friedmanniomyces endolithicus]KAK0784776.1 hypothetical protein LTR38_012549 [Friedmanniomyces endolithicus]KAK0800476.1 hypothetical protein LTR59_005745 [Friedmanniomyces endolithicus]